MSNNDKEMLTKEEREAVERVQKWHISANAGSFGQRWGDHAIMLATRTNGYQTAVSITVQTIWYEGQRYAYIRWVDLLKALRPVIKEKIRARKKIAYLVHEYRKLHSIATEESDNYCAANRRRMSDIQVTMGEISEAVKKLTGLPADFFV